MIAVTQKLPDKAVPCAEFPSKVEKHFLRETHAQSTLKRNSYVTAFRYIIYR